MVQRISRLELYNLVWSAPLTAVAPQFAVAGVTLKSTCAKFDIPLPHRGYWAKRQAGKPTFRLALPVRAPGMSDEIHVGARYYWQRSLSDKELLGPLPEPPEFSEDIALVRERIRKNIGTAKVGRVLTMKHPAISRLLAQDDARREKHRTATYVFSWEKPVFDTPFEQRRLRLLNALFLAVARGKPEVRGNEAREITITVHQTAVFLTVDRPKVTRRGASHGLHPSGGKSDPLRLAVVEGYQREEERAAWQDTEDAPLEHLIGEIAVEIVAVAELKYREGCVRQFEWRVKRKSEREEELRQRQIELKRQERERLQRLEQARIDRLLDEAASLRRATDIRAYVQAAREVAEVGIDAMNEEIERWARRALAEADRIDPVRNGRFLKPMGLSDHIEVSYPYTEIPLPTDDTKG